MTTSPDRADLAVVIGRFQMLHVGHAALLRQALEVAERCVIVLRAAFQARAPRRPLSWTEQRETIRLALPPGDRDRVDVLPMRDHHDEQRWQRLVVRAVESIPAGHGSAAHPSVALIAPLDDPTAAALRDRAGWRIVPATDRSGLDSAAIRDALFGATPEGTDAALAALGDVLAPGSADFLRAWLQLPYAEPLRAEWAALREQQRAWAGSPYPPVFVTVDAVVRCADQVLLIVRDRRPGLGLNALPGGFIEQDETLYAAAVRELAEETQLKLLDTTLRACLRGVEVFDAPLRSQRGRTITHAHCFDLGERVPPDVLGGDDAASARWVPIADLAAIEDSFLDDHFQILDHFLHITDDDAVAG